MKITIKTAMILLLAVAAPLCTIVAEEGDKYSKPTTPEMRDESTDAKGMQKHDENARARMGDSGSRAELRANVEKSLSEFRREVSGSAEVLDKAAGILVFPKITKAGIGIGGEYGRGGLYINNEIVEYYSTTSISVGLQLGVQSKSMILAFMSEEALRDFRESSNYELGVDGDVTVVDMTTSRTLDLVKSAPSILAYVWGTKGLMADVSLTGTQISNLDS